MIWFYRILRHSMIDLYRREAARKLALVRFEAEFSKSPTAGDERLPYECFRRLLPADISGFLTALVCISV